MPRLRPVVFVQMESGSDTELKALEVLGRISELDATWEYDRTLVWYQRHIC